MKTVIKNSDGKIVACLYFDEDGNLSADSWLCENGWPPKRKHPRG